MTNATFASVPSVERAVARPAEELVRLREDAALIRTLLGELERLVPAATGRTTSVKAQLIDELVRLGRHALECAATMARGSESDRANQGPRPSIAKTSVSFDDESIYE